MIGGDSPRLRLGIVGIVAISMFAALLTRLWFLQVLSAPDFQLRADELAVKVVKEPAPRGRILDRNGRVLVDNRASNIVAVDRSQLDDEERSRLLPRLAEVLKVPEQVVAERLDDQRVSPYTPVPVAEDVPEPMMVHLRERQTEFPAVVAKRVAVRAYPEGNLAAHLLGYVGEVTQEEIDASGNAYDLGDMVGKAGVEKFYEKDLRGVDGELRIEVDAKGNPVRVVERIPPKQGDDLVLSIDVEVQRTAEQALAQGLESARGRPFEDDRRPLVADAGAAVVLDAREGTVTAMASYPSFDLPALADGITRSEAEALFSEQTGAPFTNRAIQGRYAPGSTWKLVTADAALRHGLITPNFVVHDPGTYTIPGDCTPAPACIKRNAGSRAFGRVDVRRALVVSSDVFFYGRGADFWINRRQYGEEPIQDVARVLGFGSQTGVALPAEVGGRLAAPSVRAKLHEENPESFPEGDWFTGDNVNLAIGQGELAITPIQIANAYATYANGGTRYAPNLALRVQRQDGTLVRAFSPRVARQVDLPPHVRDPIMQGLAGVVSAEEGTAYNAFLGFPLAQYAVSGKTGTAQAAPKQDTALFAAFGPDLGAHRHVVAVVMEQSGFGASAAAPVARRVFGTLSGLEGRDPVQYTPLNGVGD